MAITVNLPLDKPVVTPTVTAGGSLAQNTTYYVRVMAMSGSDLRYPTQSRVSDEVSFTTTTTNLSASLSWTAPTGATNYWIYVSTTSGSYVSKCQQNYYGNTQTSTTYNLTAINNQTHGYNDGAIIWNRSTVVTGIDKTAGRLTVTFTGTVTLQDIYDAIVAAGATGNVVYDGQNFVLFGSIGCTGSTTSSLTITNTSLTFLEGTVYCSNANATITFGKVLAGNLLGYEGCLLSFPMALNHWYSLTAGTINFYGCKVTGDSKLITDVRGYIGFSSTGPTVSMTGSVLGDFGVFVTKKPLTDLILCGGTGGDTLGVECYANLTRCDLRSAWLTCYSGNVSFTDCTVRNGTSSGWGASDVQINDTASGYKCYNLLVPLRTNNFPTTYMSTGGGCDFYYNLSLTVVTSTGAAISGATVTITDANGSAVSGSPFTTDANGNIATDLYAFRLSRTAVTTGTADTQTNYSPHTVVISKTGYTPRTVIYTMNQKRIEVEKLTSDGTNIISGTLYDTTIY